MPGEGVAGPEMSINIAKDTPTEPKVVLAQNIIQESTNGNWRGALESTKRQTAGGLGGTRSQERQNLEMSINSPYGNSLWERLKAYDFVKNPKFFDQVNTAGPQEPVENSNPGPAASPEPPKSASAVPQSPPAPATGSETTSLPEQPEAGPKTPPVEEAESKEKMARLLVEQLDEELERKKNATTNETEKAMFDALKDRWKASEKFGKVKEDFKALTENGPEELMKELLKSRIVDGERKYSDAEIDNMLADKTEGNFYKKMEPEVLSQVLCRKALLEGVTSEDVSKIEKAPSFKTAIEKAAKIPKESVKGFWEILKKHPLLFVLLMFAVGGIPGAGIAFVGLKIGKAKADGAGHG